MAGDQANRPTPRQQLHPQPAIGFQAGRQRAVQGQRQEIRRQHGTECFLPRLAGDAEFQPGGQREWNPVAQQAESLNFKLILLGRRRRALTQPQNAVILQPGQWNRLPLQTQIEQGGVGGNADRFRRFAPEEPAGDPMIAGGGLERRPPVPFQHRRGKLVQPHFLGPVAAVAGQGQPAFGVGARLLAEVAAPGVEIQAQRRRPDAAALFRVGVIYRTAPVGRFAQHPADPGLQGQRDARQRVGGHRRVGGASGWRGPSQYQQAERDKEDWEGQVAGAHHDSPGDAVRGMAPSIEPGVL